VQADYWAPPQKENRQLWLRAPFTNRPRWCS